MKYGTVEELLEVFPGVWWVYCGKWDDRRGARRGVGSMIKVLRWKSWDRAGERSLRCERLEKQIDNAYIVD